MVLVVLFFVVLPATTALAVILIFDAAGSRTALT